MDDLKVFKDFNIIGACEYITNLCNLINSPSTSDHLVRSFHTLLPNLLIYVFGSPTTRGWLQIETKATQDEAIKSLLSVNGSFFKALIKTSSLTEYSYDLVTDSLPADIKRVLSAGATHLLPKVYSEYSYINTSTNSNAVDVKSAATKQSVLLLSTIGGDRKIKFNMLQFYLYYFLSVPTWPPLPPPPPTPTLTLNQPLMNVNKGVPTPTIPYGSNRPNLFSSNTPVNNNSTLPGKPRSITQSPYQDILQYYLTTFVPMTEQIAFPAHIDTFFLDAILELWIRTPWISLNQRLPADQMSFIRLLVQWIVRHDLRKFIRHQNSTGYHIYRTIKDELYMLISRLATNWIKHDDYLSVVDLWVIWAAPWKFGAEPRSLDRQEDTIAGWGVVIVDNLPFYMILVDILFQRTSTFQFKDQTKPPLTTPFTPSLTQTVNSDMGGSIGGQLRIIYRIINVMKAHGLVEFLGMIEKALSVPIKPEFCKTLSIQNYGSDTMERLMQEKLKSSHDFLIQLDGINLHWKPKGLYTNHLLPRSESILKTLNAIHQESIIRENDKQKPSNQQKAIQLKETCNLLSTIFKIVGTSHLNNNTTNNTNNTNTNSTTNTQENRSIRQREVKYAGTSDAKGFLTPEDIQAIHDGKLRCTVSNIHPIGKRAQNFVRSYEIAALVHWTITIDEKINYYYIQYIPLDKFKFLPKSLTLRPLAAKVNLIYLILTFVLFLYIFFI